MWRLNWLADTSDRGLRQSCGIMVNYKYILHDVDRNNQEYLVNGTIASSPQFLKLLGSSWWCEPFIDRDFVSQMFQDIKRYNIWNKDVILFCRLCYQNIVKVQLTLFLFLFQTIYHTILRAFAKTFLFFVKCYFFHNTLKFEKFPPSWFMAASWRGLVLAVNDVIVVLNLSKK